MIGVRVVAIGQCQDAEGPRGHGGGHPMDLLAPLGRQRLDLAVSPLPVALGKDDLGCPLGVHRRRLFGPADDDRHRLAFGIERDLVEHAVVSLPRLDVGLARGDDQGPFGRVADDLPDAVVLGIGRNLRRVAPRGDLQRPHQVGPLLRVDRFANAVRLPFDAKVEGAARLVARSADVIVGARGDDLAHGHLVAGQRAGLVGADDRDRAQRLDARQPAHQGVAPHQALQADRQHQRHDGGKAFRHRGHGQADRQQE